ncbi:hypothetical protein ACFQ3L_09445 [Lacticaseibacillus jixianensis]|uniref:DUF916 domain-containing protein n=1 Tax=Lacticaseibacillus jixianensis TaxID=2486012 RepID=A0ABW4BAH1_9LACO|nr:hypothetical protein [Lacticaseibacillus jixianensis]
MGNHFLEKRFRRTTKWLLFLALSLAALLTIGLPATIVSADGQAPLQTVIERGNQKNGYDLILRNTTNNLYRNVTVKAALPKAIDQRQVVLTWHVKAFGTADQHRLHFTLDPKQNRVAVSEKGATIAYAKQTPWLWLTVGLVVSGGAIGGLLVYRRRKAAALLLVIGVVGGGLASASLQVSQAADRASNKTPFVLNGKTYQIKTTIDYERVANAQLLPFVLRFDGAANQLTYTDLTTHETQTVAAVAHVAQTRLISTHKYQVKGQGVAGEVSPGGPDHFTVKADAGRLQAGATVTKSAGEAVLRSNVRQVGFANERYTIEPARARLIIAGSASDYRVGDVLYVPPFGFNYGGAAAKVTGVDVRPSELVLTIKSAAPQSVVHQIRTTPAGGQADVAKAVFVPVADVAVSGRRAPGMSMQQAGFFGLQVENRATTAKDFKVTFPRKQEEEKTAPAEEPAEASGSKKAGKKHQLPGEAEVVDEAHLEGTLGLTVDADFLKGNYDAKVDSGLKYDNHFNAQVTVDPDSSALLKKLADGKQVGMIIIPTNVPMVTVHIPFIIALDASGEATLTVDLNAAAALTAEVTNQKGKKPASVKPDLSCSFKGNVDVNGTLTPAVKTKLEPVILGEPLVAINASAGVEIKADASFHCSGSKVSPTAAAKLGAREHASVEGNFVAKTSAETEVGQLFHVKDVKTDERTFRHQLFKWQADASQTATLGKPAGDPSPAAYAKGFKAITVPANMRGTWYGYEAYSDTLTTITFGQHTIAQVDGTADDGRVYSLYDEAVRTAEDQHAREQANGGSLSPQYTAGDRYRADHWWAASLAPFNGKAGLRVWNTWYPSDSGKFYCIEQKQVAGKTVAVLTEPEYPDQIETFYHDKAQAINSRE